jgi:hypothetical protein
MCDLCALGASELVKDEAAPVAKDDRARDDDRLRRRTHRV